MLNALACPASSMPRRGATRAVRVFWRFLLLALPATLAGCLHYKARVLTAASNLTDLESRRLDAPDLARALQENHLATSWPPQTWDLDALTLVAFYYHPD